MSIFLFYKVSLQLEPLTELSDKSTSNPNKDVKDKRQVPTTTISAQTRLHSACNEQESAVSSSGIAQRSDLLLMKIQNTVFSIVFLLLQFTNHKSQAELYLFFRCRDHQDKSSSLENQIPETNIPYKHQSASGPSNQESGGQTSSDLLSGWLTAGQMKITHKYQCVLC